MKHDDGQKKILIIHEAHFENVTVDIFWENPMIVLIDEKSRMYSSIFNYLSLIRESSHIICHVVHIISQSV